MASRKLDNDLWTSPQEGRQLLRIPHLPVSGCVVPLVADVRDRASLEAKLDDVLPGLGGSIHAVANVAGVHPPSMGFMNGETVTLSGGGAIR